MWGPGSHVCPWNCQVLLITLWNHPHYWALKAIRPMSNIHSCSIRPVPALVNGLFPGQMKPYPRLAPCVVRVQLPRRTTWAAPPPQPGPPENGAVRFTPLNELSNRIMPQPPALQWNFHIMACDTPLWRPSAAAQSTSCWLGTAETQHPGSRCALWYLQWARLNTRGSPCLRRALY